MGIPMEADQAPMDSSDVSISRFSEYSEKDSESDSESPLEVDESESTPEVEGATPAEVAEVSDTEARKEKIKKLKLSRKKKNILKQKRRLQQMKLRGNRSPRNHVKNGRRSGYKR